MKRLLVCLALLLACMPAGARSADKKPQSPVPLWVFKAPEHFVAAPVVGDGVLYVAGLGAFNTGLLHALALDPAASERELWSKAPPYLKLPTVSAPAVNGENVVFGDGMHQTDGATLHCLAAKGGRPLWQLDVPGELVHLEGTPVVAEGKVYIGGGNAGVLAVDPSRLTLAGQETTPAEAQKQIEALWQAALARYEAEKQQDPMFAVPPTEDSLPKPAPKIIWQQGQGRWHVDGSLALAGDRLLVPSTYLDQEKTGERAVLCLSAADGHALWRTPLKYNPWAGPTIDGEHVIVVTSSIRLDPKTLKGARGEIVVLALADGAVLWRKEVAGGIVSPAVVRGENVLFTASDGKLRAWDRTTGEPRWVYDAKMPLFAGPVAGDETAYAADLKGVVHAVGLADGRLRWTFDLGSDPAVQAPGMIYGTPALHAGRLYVATCNIESGGGRQRPGVVVCLGDK